MLSEQHQSLSLSRAPDSVADPDLYHVGKTDPDAHQIKIPELWRLRMEPRRAVDARNEGKAA
jgi:hypothetical protein